MANNELLSTVDVADFVTEHVGEITLSDIITELKKPGRDPRPEFKTATFKDGVETIADLEVGMMLEGVISNVANFGAFVDLGVHQDGLVHISAITDKFISDPREIVKAGDIVKVKVLDVDVARKRINLTMRLDDKASNIAKRPHGKGGENKPAQDKRHHAKVANKPHHQKPRKDKAPGNAAMGNAFADALAKLKNNELLC